MLSVCVCVNFVSNFFLDYFGFLKGKEIEGRKGEREKWEEEEEE